MNLGTPQEGDLIFLVFDDKIHDIGEFVNLSRMKFSDRLDDSNYVCYKAAKEKKVFTIFFERYFSVSKNVWKFCVTRTSVAEGKFLFNGICAPYIPMQITQTLNMQNYTPKIITTNGTSSNQMKILSQ